MVFLVVPKIIIFLGILWAGSVYLLNERDRSELILNAVALVFVVDIHKLVFIACTSRDIREKMNSLDPWYQDDSMHTPADSDSDEEAEEERMKELNVNDSERSDDEHGTMLWDSRTSSEQEAGNQPPDLSVDFRRNSTLTSTMSKTTTMVSEISKKTVVKTFTMANYLKNIFSAFLFPVMLGMVVCSFAGYYEWICESEHSTL